jgi:hypothetical protein
MNKTTFRISLSFTLLALLLCSVANAKSVRVRVLDSDLSKLPFGSDTQASVKWVEKKVNASFGPRLKGALDQSERAKVIKAIAAKMIEVRESMVEFKGQKTGLENSVLSDEFVHGAKESMLRYREGSVDHYLLFTDGKLWKYIRALKAEGKFGDRLKKHARDFGTPTSMKSNKGNPTEATWQGDKIVLSIRDLRSVYGTDLLIVIDQKMKTSTDKRRRENAQEKAPDIDPELQGILED